MRHGNLVLMQIFWGELVLEGKKTATAGALKSYQFENVGIPRLGQYNIVLDSKNQPLCIIRTTKVEIIPFLEVSSEQAYKEGENDRTLESWRNGFCCKVLNLLSNKVE
ncbi:ASCH domain-containing protein [Streptococcus suis]